MTAALFITKDIATTRYPMNKVKRAPVRAAFQTTQPSVADRAGSFPEEIRGISGNILVSTHAIAMKGILEYLTTDTVGGYWSRYIGNCTVYYGRE